MFIVTNLIILVILKKKKKGKELNENILLPDNTLECFTKNKLERKESGRIRK